MANVKFSELVSATPLGTDFVPIIQSDGGSGYLNKKTTVNKIFSSLSASSAPANPSVGDIWVDTVTPFYNNSGIANLVAQGILLAPATTLTVSELNSTLSLFTLDVYIAPSTATSNILLSFNGDTTDSNYKSEYHGVNSAGTASIGAANNSRLLFPHVNTGGGVMYLNIVRGVGNYLHCFYEVQYFDGGTYPVFRKGVIYWVPNGILTSISISSSSNNGLSTDTSIKVFSKGV